MIDVENESENNSYLILMAAKWLQISKIYTSTEVPERFMEQGGCGEGKGAKFWKMLNLVLLLLL